MAYIGKQPVVGNFVKLDAITTSATATYNLLNGGVAYFPQTANNCIVSLNGVIQSPTSAYTISGSTIVFSDALTASDSIDFILVLGDVLSIGTPSDGTVGFAKVTSNLITGATAETSIAGGDSVLIYDDSASALRKMTKTNLFSGVAVNAPAFFAYATANQNFTNGVESKIVFDAELFDTASCFDSTTNYRFTPNVAGYYDITAGINFSANTSVSRFLTIKKNGSVIGSHTIQQANGTNFIDAKMSILMEMNGSTDYVEAFASQNSGVTLNSGIGSPAYQSVHFFGFLARTN